MKICKYGLRCIYCKEPAVVIAYGFSLCMKHAKELDKGTVEELSKKVADRLAE